ncbi:OadG family protein [Enterococcus sp. 669A]|uniref:OadG family protein n=1 Tax=Candidatus Enterococcus moelleringii TaxID=2815325 RepID=A0ABS3LEL2_9ENTE|nr:OadG family protein [Enterococcus sp. 669A]MBO1308072.1 OadG family protein [Enterococcus sp. 669A]
MEFNLMDSLELTVVAMALVFLVLAGLMLLMMGTAKIAQAFDKPSEEVQTPEKPAVQATAGNDPERERVAVLCALAEAAQENANKHYEIEKVERIK